MTRRARDDDDRFAGEDDVADPGFFERHSGGAGSPAGDWAGMRPTIDNPFTWSLPLARISGITVRIHLLFLAYIVIEMSRAALGAQGYVLDFTLTAITMGLLVVIVLAHEFGHCLACRLADGEADEILMWPLGGLAFCHPPPRWQAHLLTAIGGPLVNLVICLISGTMLWLAMRHDRDWPMYVLPNPLDIGSVLVGSPLQRSTAHLALYMTNAISLVMLLFNLLPVFPLDGGRIAQTLLWPRLGWSGSMRWAVRIGYVGSLAMCVFGAIAGLWMIIAVGGFGLISCYLKHRQLEFSDAMMAAADASDDDDDTALFSENEAAQEEKEEQDRPAATATSIRAERAAQQRVQKEQEEAAEVDRILLKIAQQGMSSLTRNERSTLERATERKRRGS